MAEPFPPPPSVDGPFVPSSVMPTGDPSLTDDRLAADRLALSEPQRQSLLGPFFIALGAIRRFGFINLAFFGFALTGRWSTLLQIGAVAVIGALAVGAVLSWWMFRFHVEGDELIVQRGVLARERKTLPLSRIQSVSVDQQLLHRMVGLVRARVETAGSAGAEFSIDAIDKGTADSIRRLVIAERASVVGADATDDAVGAGDLPTTAATAVADAEGTIMLRRSTMDLVKVALTRNPLPGLAFVGATLGLYEDAAGFFGLSLDSFEGQLDTILASLAVIIPIVVVFGVLVIFIFGIVSTLTRFHDLTLWRTPDGLRTTAGLFSRLERTSPLNRIQIVRTRQNLIERFFDIRVVTLPTASTSVSDAHTLRLPGTTRAELDDIRGLLTDAAAERPSLTQGIAPVAVRRWFLFGGVLPAIAAGLAIGWRFGWLGALTVLWLPIAWVSARAVHARWRWDLNGTSLEVEHGLITKLGALVALHKTQVVEVRRSLFHRRNDLASLVVATASGRVFIPHLPLATALDLRDRILFHVETSRRSWM